MLDINKATNLNSETGMLEPYPQGETISSTEELIALHKKLIEEVSQIPASTFENLDPNSTGFGSKYNMGNNPCENCPNNPKNNPFSSGFWSGFEPNPNEGYINCGDNVNYFLAIAALRDDTDDFQWLTNDDHTYWGRKETICMPSKYMQLEGHKATLEELIKFYNK